MAAGNVYKKTGDITGTKRWPTKVPEGGEFGYALEGRGGGSAGRPIPAHPIYKHRADLGVKRSKQQIGGGESAIHMGDFTSAGYTPEQWSAETGLTQQQWRQLTGKDWEGMDLEDTTGLSSEETGIYGGKWRTSDADAVYDIGGDYSGIGGTHREGKDYWESLYESGAYGFPSWTEGWYKPARKVAVEQPMTELREEEFETIQDVVGGPGALPGEEFRIMKSPTDPLEGTEIVERASALNLTGLLGIASQARADYESQMDKIYGEGGLQEQGKKSVALAKKQAVQGGISTHQAREAARAATGMAFSGPAERAIEDVAKGRVDTFSQYATKKQEIESSIEDAKNLAWDEYAGPGGSLDTYWTQVMEVFSKAEEGAAAVGNIGKGLLSAWEELPGSLGLTAAPISKAPGYGGFAEVYTGLPQYKDLMEGTVTPAVSMARDVVTQANIKRQQYQIGSDAPDFPEGGY